MNQLKKAEQSLVSSFQQGDESSIRTICEQILMDLRGVDIIGAKFILDQDDELVNILGKISNYYFKREIFLSLFNRLVVLGQAQICLECATCCRISSPTLYLEDISLLDEGKNIKGVRRDQLITLRPGEVVHSNRLGNIFTLQTELVKLGERSFQKGCLFLERSSCLVYEKRPLQCREQKCWSNNHVIYLRERPHLTRFHIYENDTNALALIEEFETKLPAAGLTNFFLRIVHEKDELSRNQAREELLDLIELESRLRVSISNRYGYSLEELNLLLGRSCWEMARNFGIFFR